MFKHLLLYMTACIAALPLEAAPGDLSESADIPRDFMGSDYAFRANERLIWNATNSMLGVSNPVITAQYKLVLDDQLQTAEHRYLAASAYAIDVMYFGLLPELRALCKYFPPRDDDFNYLVNCMIVSSESISAKAAYIQKIAENAFIRYPKREVASQILDNSGVYLTEQGNVVTSIHFFNRAIEMLPEGSINLVMDIKAHLALVYMNPILGKSGAEKSIEYLSQVREHYRQLGAAGIYDFKISSFNIGVVKLFLFQNPVEAIANFQLALDNDRLKYDALIFSAYSYAQNNDAKQARKLLNKVDFSQITDVERIKFLRCYYQLTQLVIGDKSDIKPCLSLESPQTDVLLNLTETLGRLHLPAAEENVWWRIFYHNFTEKILPNIQQNMTTVSSDAELIHERAESVLKDLKLKNLTLYKYLFAAVGGLAIVMAVLGIMSWKARMTTRSFAQRVNQQRNRLQNILDSIGESIYRIDTDLTMQAESSANFHANIGSEFAVSTSLFEFFRSTQVPEDSIATSMACLQASFGEGQITWDMNHSNLPNELINDQRILSLSWQPIFTYDMLSAVLLVIRDISEVKMLAQAQQQSQLKADKLLITSREILTAQPRAIMSFLKQLPDQLQTLQILISQSKFREAMLPAHTIKGSARSLGLSELKESLHRLEDQLQTSSKSAIESAFADMRLVSDMYRDSQELLTLNRSDQPTTLLDIISELRTDASRLLKEQGLQIKELVVKEIGTLEVAEYEQVKIILLHGLMNALDHGFIRPKQRGLKISNPCLHIELQADGPERSLILRDNGVGIDHGAIQKLAAVRNWQPQEGRPWSDLLFEDGVSTSEKISQTSGRGVGLAAIRQAVNSLRGKASLVDSKGQNGSELLVSWTLSMNAA